MLEKNDVLKQRKMNEFFKTAPKEISNGERENTPIDIEDTGRTIRPIVPNRPVTHKRKRTNSPSFDENQLSQHWRDVLGPPPPLGKTKEEITTWIRYQKRKWELQSQQRKMREGGSLNKRGRIAEAPGSSAAMRKTGTIGGFIRKAQRTILDCPWQVIQVKVPKSLILTTIS